MTKQEKMLEALKAMASTGRVAILMHLRANPGGVIAKELETVTGCTQPTVHYHLKHLSGGRSRGTGQ
jgi:DNA-binding transcriptional ArsR family regulator